MRIQAGLFRRNGPRLALSGGIWYSIKNASDRRRSPVVLYRPVGTKELELIRDSGYAQYPPRLPEQPIFYPVLNEEYAIEIAAQWNVKHNSDHKGYVTQFEIDDAYVWRFPVHTVGPPTIRRVPAEELETFNRHILGKIQVIHAFSKE